MVRGCDSVIVQLTDALRLRAWYALVCGIRTNVHWNEHHTDTWYRPRPRSLACEIPIDRQVGRLGGRGGSAPTADATRAHPRPQDTAFKYNVI
eukprot:COSAG02_NODE_726_length_18005_cov_69.224897_16_plen_93_part_00